VQSVQPAPAPPVVPQMLNACVVQSLQPPPPPPPVVPQMLNA
jgi:hypothetical protein